jgi:hypothetical protein
MDIYLGRIVKIEGAEALENALQGKSGQIGPTVSLDNVPYEPIAVNPNYSMATSPAVREMLTINKEQTDAVHSHFMFGDDIDTVMDNLATLSIQPTSEDAIERIADECPEQDDFFARDMVAAYIMRVPEETFQGWIDAGMAATREDKYYETLHGEQVLIPEAILGDKAIRAAITNKQIIAFDEVHKVFDMTGHNYDPYDVFPRDFKSAMAIKYKEPTVETVVDGSNKYSAYPELAQAYRQIIRDDTLSPEEKELMISSLDEMYDRGMDF